MLNIHELRLKISENDNFILLLIGWTIFMPFYLLGYVEFEHNVNQFKISHLYFVISYIYLQFFLTKFVPSNKNILVNYENKFINIKYNGPLVTSITFIGFLLLNYFKIISRTYILLNFKYLIYSKIIIALILTFVNYLYTINHFDRTKSKIYNFFWGMDYFPYLYNVNLKILNNCRIGMTLWLLYITGFLIGHYELFNHVTNSLLVNYILVLSYLYKFFIWEDGYYNTLDIIMDKLGYWLIYGCMVYVPCIYTFSTYYFAINNYDNLNFYTYLIILCIGLISITLNYACDLDKKIFKETNGLYINNYNTAKYIYNINNQKILINGWWGVVRKPNYLFELIAAFTFSCLHGFNNILPYTYFIILFGLLMCRIYIDELRCTKKYGDLYTTYMKIVKYKLIPYVF